MSAVTTDGADSTMATSQMPRNAKPCTKVTPGTRLNGLSPGAATGTTNCAEVTAHTPYEIPSTPRLAPSTAGACVQSPENTNGRSVPARVSGSASVAAARVRP